MADASEEARHMRLALTLEETETVFAGLSTLAVLMDNPRLLAMTIIADPDMRAPVMLLAALGGDTGATVSDVSEMDRDTQKANMLRARGIIASLGPRLADWIRPGTGSSLL